MVPAGLRWISDGRGEVRYRLDGGFPRRRAVVYRGARTHLTSSSFPVSRCGAPSISVTSVPLVPPSARSASLHAALAIVGACTNGRMRASAPTTWTVAFRIPEKTDGCIPRIPVGADALIGPLHRLPLTSRPAAAKREAETMRQPPRQPPHHPPRDGSIQESQKRIACPKARQNRRLHRSVDPRQRGGTKVPERAKRFSLWTVRLRSRWRLCRLRMRHTPCGYDPFLFWQDKREMGGASCMDNAPWGNRNPPWPPEVGPHSYGRLITAPTVLPEVPAGR